MYEYTFTHTYTLILYLFYIHLSALKTFGSNHEFILISLILIQHCRASFLTLSLSIFMTSFVNS